MKYPFTGIAELCKLFGKTRDAWYKQQSFYERRQMEQAIVLEVVRQLRSTMPGLGVRKLHHEVNTMLAPQEISIGRNRLNVLLREHNLLNRPARKRVRTTNSRHRFRKWPNLIENFVPTRPEELIVCDITYWRIDGGHIFLSLATDAYSHMIMGYYVGQTLYATGPLRAMQMALQSRMYPDQEMIHHSDRGIQYCSFVYVDLLQSHDIRISMTQSGDPTDNPIAERVNGLLKQHFGLPYQFDDHASAVEPIAKAIRTYNYEFPHGSINYLKPYQAHRISGPIRKRWK